MESTLYEVLSSDALAGYYQWNNEHKNKALYENRALWSPYIKFQRDDETAVASVLTCAAPNRKAYFDHMKDADEAEALAAMRGRISFIADIIGQAGGYFDTAIFGAFGCGVFGWDPETVAGIFKETFKEAPLKRIVYAVIDTGGHSKEGACAAFKKVFEN